VVAPELSNLKVDKHASFPLARYFYLGVLPALLLVVATTIYATTETARLSTIEVLLQLASRRVDGIATGVQAAAPDAWHKLLSNTPLIDTDRASLAEAFAHEQRETKIATLKVYNSDRKTVFATEPSEIGNIEDNRNFGMPWHWANHHYWKSVIRSGKRSMNSTYLIDPMDALRLSSSFMSRLPDLTPWCGRCCAQS
jgi:hypothetical protein